MYVVNRSRGTYVGVDVKRANSFGARMLGLYGRRKLLLGDGVWLVPCKGIQTIGMRTVIDVIFLDAASRVVRVFEHVPPGRVIWWVPEAHSALEVPEGVVESSETHTGDWVQLADDLPSGPTGGQRDRRDRPVPVQSHVPLVLLAPPPDSTPAGGRAGPPDADAGDFEG